jgi:hypothetical protein
MFAGAAQAPEIGCPPPSNMSDMLTAKRAPFGQKLVAGALTTVVAALAAPGTLPAPEAIASAAVPPTVFRASRRLRREEWIAGLVMALLLLLSPI